MVGSAFHLGSQLYYIYVKSDWNLIAIESHERIERDKMMAAQEGGPAGNLEMKNIH